MKNPTQFYMRRWSVRRLLAVPALLLPLSVVPETAGAADIPSLPVPGRAITAPAVRARAADTHSLGNGGIDTIVGGKSVYDIADDRGLVTRRLRRDPDGRELLYDLKNIVTNEDCTFVLQSSTGKMDSGQQVASVGRLDMRGCR